MHQKLKQIVLAGLTSLMAAMIILIASCCDDCPTCPGSTQPYRGYLYAADYENGWIYQIDTENDSLIDSVNYFNGQKYYTGTVSVSSDGRYFAAAYSLTLYTESMLTTVIYDAQTLNMITELPYSYNSVFIPNQNLYLGFMQDSVHIYSTPDFTRIHSDTITSYAFPVLDESENRVYLHGIQTPDRLDSTYIAAYDYVQRKVVDTWFLRDSQDSLMIILQFDVNRDENLLYCTGGSDVSGLYLACYDLNERETIFREPITSRYGSMRLSPDGAEVYMTDPGQPFINLIPGIIFVYNAQSGNYVDGISLYGLDENPAVALFATPIIFTPTGEKAYVGSGRTEKDSGTISVIDTKDKMIIKHIWPNKGHYFLYMCIGPKL